MVTTRHEFLAMLHAALQPRGYLEIGVMFGDSLRLAKCRSIGIDPEPRLRYHLPSYDVYSVTSDDFFASVPGHVTIEPIDLAFIDGMHLMEFALRDFQNVELYANERTVIVFDDVLPRNQEEAARKQPPGDWTGDVWKVPKLLDKYRTDLHVYWVDTEPTGTAVVYGFQPGQPHADVIETVEGLGLESWELVPEDVLKRVQAVTPEFALDMVTHYLKGLDT